MDIIESGWRIYLGFTGSLVLLAAARLIVQRLRLTQSGVRTDGHVVGWRMTWDSMEDRRAYYPRIRFTASNGSIHEFTSSSGYDCEKWPLGKRIEVLFDPLEPSRVEVRAPARFWGGPLILALLGLAALVPALR